MKRFACTVAVLFAVSGEAWAQSAPASSGTDVVLEEAKQRYRHGVELYGEGDYKLALIEFQRSYDLSPNYRILFNLGQVHFQLNNYSQALKAFEEYIAAGKDDVEPKRREQVDRDIQTLKGRTAYLSVKANVENAEVFVDDISIGKMPIDRRLVDAGSHKISAKLDGYKESIERVTLAGKDEKTIVLKFAKEPDKTIIIDAGGKGVPAPVWVGWSITAAFVAGTVTTGLLANSASDSAAQVKLRQGVTRAEIDSANRKTNTLTALTLIFGGASLVGAGVSTFLTIRYLNSKDDEKANRLEKPKDGPTPRKLSDVRTSGVTMSGHVGLGSIYLEGSF